MKTTSPSFAKRCFLLFLITAALAIAGCSDGSSPTDSDAHQSDDSARLASTASGMTFTISGPALDGPQTFHIPNDTPELSKSISDTGVMLQLRRNSEIRTADNRHQLDQLILRVNGGVGEHRQGESVENAWFSFSFDAGTDAGQSASMDYSYSKGEMQPVTITIDSLEPRSSVTGHFQARMQRTNIRSNDQFYDIEGNFNLTRD